MIEHFFRTPKEDCTWQYNFSSFVEVKATISNRIGWYNAERPHSSLGYQSPQHFRQQEVPSLA
jgi:putative transposase